MSKLEIIKISWERIYLVIKFNHKIENDLYLYDEKLGKKKICNDYVNNDTLRMPITCAYDDTMIESGNWVFLYGDETITLILDECDKLDEYTRVFYYRSIFAYIVTFSINDKLELIMKIDYMKKNNKPYKDILYKIIPKLYYKLCLLFTRKKGNTILFMSETRDNLEGNLKALSDRMVERGLDKDYKLTYSFNKLLNGSLSPKYFLKTIKKIAKADYIFIDDYAPTFGVIKLKKTKLIQVWHAGVGFKSVGYSRFGKEGSPHPLISAHRNYDYATVASDNLISTYQEVFGLTRKHFLVPGMLRLDGYLDENRISDTKKSLYEKYQSIKDKKVILFAPTYRGMGQREAYYDYDKIDFDELYKLCKKENYVVLFKIHPFVDEKVPIKEEYKDLFIDVKDYKDINELFYITDILITDYSSAIYEFSLFEKPIIFFDYDKDKYQVIRGVHNDLNSSPGDVCTSFDEVLKLLKNKNFDIDKVKKYKEKNILIQDELACDKLIKMIFNK